MNEKERFLKKVWPRIEEFFDRFGPANYEGFLGGDNPGWLGPYIWSENGDSLRVITKFCEDEFGFLNVHNESKICKFMYANFDEGKKWSSVDIDITDASECKDHKDFRNFKHTLFIEVKHIQKGAIFRTDDKGFREDCSKLQKQIDKGRCEYAIAILIDDGNLKGKSYIKNKDHLLTELKKDFPDIEPLIWQKNQEKSNADENRQRKG